MQMTSLFKISTRLTLASLLVGTTAFSVPAQTFDRTVALNDHQQPAIPRPEQEAAAQAELDAFIAAHGQRPNIVGC